MDSYPSEEVMLGRLLEKMEVLVVKVAGMDAKITTMSQLLEAKHTICGKCQHMSEDIDKNAIRPEDTNCVSKSNGISDEGVEATVFDDVDGGDGQSHVPEEPHLEDTVELRHKDKSSSPGQRRRGRQRSTGDNKGDRLGRALQANIVAMVETVPFSCCELADLIINAGCVTEDECAAIRKCPNPKDEMRNVVRLIKGRSYSVIKSFLECVEKFSPEVTKTVWSTFQKNKHAESNRQMCAFCRLRRSVNIRLIADHVWSIGAIADELYEEIVSYNHSDKDLDSVWQKLGTECNKHVHNKPVVEKVIHALESKGHFYSHIIKELKRESKLICRCDALDAGQGDVSWRQLVSQDDDDDDDGSTVSPPSSIGMRDNDLLSDTASTDDDVAHQTYPKTPLHPFENTHVHFVLPNMQYAAMSRRKSILTTIHLEDTIDELDCYGNETGNYPRSNSVGKDYRKQKDVNVHLNRRRLSLPVAFW